MNQSFTLDPKARRKEETILDSFLRKSSITNQPAERGVMPGDVLLGRFVVEEEEACGGCCIVHLARDLHRSRLVAVKSLLPAETRFSDLIRNRFSLECSLMQKVRHGAFPRFIAEGRKNGEPFMIMEWLEGTTLATLMAAGNFKGMSGVQADYVVNALISAIGYLHAHGITHGDIKPGNILFETSGKLRIIDLGSAVHRPQKENASGYPSLLTPAFSSPEQMEGQQAQSRDDVFAMACILCILLEGRHPFGFQNALDARTCALTPSLPSYLPLAHKEVLKKALSFNPAERPKNAAAFLKLYRQTERKRP